MITVKCLGGGELQWDDSLTVGTLVTTYFRGYYILHRLAVRENNPPLMYFTQVAQEDGTLVHGKVEKCCDASYVQRVDAARIDADYDTVIRASTVKRDNLKQFV